MAGKEDWSGDKVKKVFDTWKGLLAHPPDRLARAHLAGGGSVAPAEEGRHVPPRRLRRAAVHQGCRAGRPRLLHLPGGRLDHRHRRHRGAHRRLHDVPSGRRTRTAPRSCSTTSAPPTRRTSPSRPTRASSRRTTRPTSRLHRPAEEVGRVRQVGQVIAQFLDRDTRPDFASTVMIPALQSFIKNPNDIDGLRQEHRDSRRRASSPADPMTIANARTAAPSSGDRAGSADATGGSTSSAGCDRVVVVLMVVVPTLLRPLARLVPGGRLGPALVHQLGRDRRRSARSSSSA